MNQALTRGLVCIVIAATMSCRGVTRNTSSGSAVNLPVADSRERTLQFSGYEWRVKASDDRVGPGSNYFSDSADNIEVDAQGRLHIRITQREGRWFCAEVISTRSFGYGTYRFYLATKAESLDPEAVLGMFTWNNDPAYAHRELDIEISRWGHANNKNAQFVVQPYSHLGNMVRFQMPSGLSSSLHSFNWKPDNVHFQSIADYTSGWQVIQQHTFTKDIPKAGDENARINLWLMASRPPTDGKPMEVIISKFEFIPL
jgi:hypothetical protein